MHSKLLLSSKIRLEGHGLNVPEHVCNEAAKRQIMFAETIIKNSRRPLINSEINVFNNRLHADSGVHRLYGDVKHKRVRIEG